MVIRMLGGCLTDFFTFVRAGVAVVHLGRHPAPIPEAALHFPYDLELILFQCLEREQDTMPARRDFPGRPQTQADCRSGSLPLAVGVAVITGLTFPEPGRWPGPGAYTVGFIPILDRTPSSTGGKDRFAGLGIEALWRGIFSCQATTGPNSSEFFKRSMNRIRVSSFLFA